MTRVHADGTVEFRFFRSEVAVVSVAGDFNGWCNGQLTMTQEPGGWWVAQARLAPGEYRFRYVADGRWFTDFASYGVEADNDTWNSVLLVPENTEEETERVAA